MGSEEKSHNKISLPWEVQGGALSNVQKIVLAHGLVYNSGKPNYLGQKIRSPSKIDVIELAKWLTEYGDRQVLDLIYYGFPVGHDGRPTNNEPVKNHGGAKGVFEPFIEQYLEKEAKRGSLIGPFRQNPFLVPLTYSPLNSVPKKTPGDRRIVSDMSAGGPLSLNAGISKEFYLEDEMNLRYSSTDNLVEMILEHGAGCYMYRLDAKSYYRQLFVDYGDLHLLAFTYKGGVYVDITLSMGMRSAPFLAQRVTSAISAAFEAKTKNKTVTFIDDYAGCNEKQKCFEARYQLSDFFKSINLVEAEDKAYEPSTCMPFLGITHDSIAMTQTIPLEKLEEIRAHLESWDLMEKTNLKSCQSLVGRLCFASSCVRAGRIFYSRVLTFLKQFKGDESITLEIPEEVRGDIAWWKTFMWEFNGISMMPEKEWSQPDVDFAVDACLSGSGGFNKRTGDYFHTEFPPSVAEKMLAINELELLTIVVALKAWAPLCNKKRVMIFTDNETSAILLKTGAARNRFSQACLREICYLCAKNHMILRGTHISGASNRAPDFLSRWHLDKVYRSKFRALVKGVKVREIQVTPEMFEFSAPW